MPKRFKLDDILKGLELQCDLMPAYLDRETGTVEFLADDGLAENEALAEQIENDTEGRFVELPDRLEVNEWDMMRRFAQRQSDPAQHEALLQAISGRGAFRSFKDRLNELGLSEHWYAFRDEQSRELALDWCRNYGIDLETDGSDETSA